MLLEEPDPEAKEEAPLPPPVGAPREEAIFEASQGGRASRWLSGEGMMAKME